MNLHDGQLGKAEQLIKAFHYSRRMPSNIQLCLTDHESGGLFDDFGPAQAAVLFSIPPTRWSEDVLELSRLVRSDCYTKPLTKLISKSISICKGLGWDLVVSFADSTQGHHGGIYQAASWNFHEKRVPRMDGILKDGVFIPGRSCNSIFGTRSPDKLKERFPQSCIKPHYDQGKYCYWKALTKGGRRKAATLGLESNEYHKPEMQNPSTNEG